MKRIVLLTVTAGLSLGLIASATAQNNPAKPETPAKQPGEGKGAQLIDVARAEKLIEAKKVLIVDVRTPKEFAAGHLAGATNVDFRDKDFEAKAAKLPKDQPILVHCASGVRSAKACEIMTRLQFPLLYDLKGGIHAWEAAGKPVVK